MNGNSKIYWFSYNQSMDAGILRNKTMADKLIFIPNDDTQNYPFSRLQIVVEPFEH